MKSNKRHNAIRLYEILGDDSGFITSIPIQKKNSNRYSIFVNDRFIIGVSDSCLVQFNLKKGDLLNQKKLDEIEQYEERWAVREYLFRLLGRRDHATFELKQKAIKKGFNGAYVDEILIELEKKGYINNAQFARKFARDKFKFNNWGTQKIRVELMKKGIQSNDINIALDLIGVDEQILKMDHLYEKSRPKFQRAEPEKRKKKIFDFFIRKGYDSDQILSAIPKWLNDLES